MTTTIDTLVPEQPWQTIQPLLPTPPRRHGGRPRVDDRAALAGIVYQLRTGVPWQLLPVEQLGCGSPVTCWRRLRDWQRAGVWQQLHHVPPAADGRGGARPIRGSVGALGVLAPERSWWLLAQTTSAPAERPAALERSGVVAVVDPASRQATGVSRRCPACGVHPSSFGVRIRLSGRPVSGHLGSPSRASGGRPSAVHPSSVQPSAVRPVRCPAVWCLPPSIRTRPYPPTSGGGVGDPGRGGRDAGDAADVGLVSGRSVADPGRRVGWGPRRRACPLSDQAGQAGAPSARRGGCAVGAGAGCSARWLHPPRGWRPRAGGATTVRGRRRA
jgi:transposase